MKSVKVLGSGCANCKTTFALIEDVAREIGVPVTIEKVEDMQKIVAFGVMSTPGVVVGDKVVHSGGIPDRARIAGWLK